MNYTLPKPVLISLLGILFVLCCIGSFFLGTYTKKPAVRDATTTLSSPTQTTATQSSDWKKPKSSEKGFVIIPRNPPKGSRPVFIYSFATKKTTSISLDVGISSFASGLGGGDPVVSPDFYYTAYIDGKTHNLWLFSNQTQKSTQITTGGSVAFITAWSPDSTKILYVVNKDTIEERVRGYGGIDNASTTFDKNPQKGFFLFDINNGQTTNIYPISQTEGFVDNNRLLTFVNTSDNGDQRLIVFDTQSFTMDYSAKELFGFGTNQYSITKDGKYWSYTLSRHPTDDANIIYAPFPQKEGVQIDSGSWAQVQNSHINPQGTYIAYSRADSNTNGVPNTVTMIYNISTKDRFQAIPGSPVMWFDETHVIVVTYPSDTQVSYTLYDVATKTSEKMN